MAIDWQSWCAQLGQVQDDVLHLALAADRSHAVHVVEHPDQEMLELSGCVREIGPDERIEALLRPNQGRRIVGLVVDAGGWLWVTALLPTVGLTAEEFQVVALEVAREADRLEYLATGENQY